MAWTVTAEDYSSALPGSVLVTVTGDPDTPLELYRVVAGEPVAKVRNTTDAVTSDSGLYRVIDAEPPFGNVRYLVTTPADPAVEQYSNEVNVPVPDDGRALIRSILSPFGAWAAVVIVDEVAIDYRSSSTVYDPINRPDPVVVSDVRRARSGTLVLSTDSIGAADYLLSMLDDGSPVLLRACSSPRRVRDAYLYPLDVREERWGYGTRRLITVDYQSVSTIAGDAPLPDVETWTYGNLATQATAPTYGALPVEWSDYFDLATRPVP